MTRSATILLLLLVLTGCTSPGGGNPGGFLNTGLFAPSPDPTSAPAGSLGLAGMWPLTLIGGATLVLGIFGRKAEWVALGIGLILVPTLLIWLLHAIMPGVTWLVWGGLAIAILMLLAYLSARLWGWHQVKECIHEIEEKAANGATPEQRDGMMTAVRKLMKASPIGAQETPE